MSIHNTLDEFNYNTPEISDSLPRESNEYTAVVEEQESMEVNEISKPELELESELNLDMELELKRGLEQELEQELEPELKPKPKQRKLNDELDKTLFEQFMHNRDYIKYRETMLGENQQCFNKGKNWMLFVGSNYDIDNHIFRCTHCYHGFKQSENNSGCIDIKGDHNPYHIRCIDDDILYILIKSNQ